ncbi:MAG: AhpC/TSA family protein [Bacteroidetes bacterium]|nr:AhpC/TSA family protein [Bacteroidota bacterium]
MTAIRYKLFIPLFLISCFCLQSCVNQDKDTFTIVGEIKGINQGNALLYNLEETGPRLIDSSKIDNGKFSFKGKITLPEMVLLKIDGNRAGIPFFLEAGKIRFKASADSLNGANISGSESNDLYQKFHEEMHRYDEQSRNILDRYMQAKSNSDTSLMNKFYEANSEVDKERIIFTRDFVKQNRESNVAIFIAATQLIYSMEADDLKQISDAFPYKLKDSKYLRLLSNQVKALNRVSIGQPAPSFTLNDINNHPVRLSDFKGKIILVDFWASWCKPCREEHPDLISIYQKYKDKNFDILSVSIDEDMTLWRDAVKLDKLTWSQISDLKGLNNVALKQYGVVKIPSNVLIDKSGIIMARNIKPKQLAEKLKQLLK